MSGHEGTDIERERTGKNNVATKVPMEPPALPAFRWDVHRQMQLGQLTDFQLWGLNYHQPLEIRASSNIAHTPLPPAALRSPGANRAKERPVRQNPAHASITGVMGRTASLALSSGKMLISWRRCAAIYSNLTPSHSFGHPLGKMSGHEGTDIERERTGKTAGAEQRD